MTPTHTVTSVLGTRYRIGRELGRGGQGVVFELEGGRLAVKLLRDRSGPAQERLRDRLAMVGRLPLEGLAVARPKELLRPPHVGYVMELFTGMAPLQALLRPPRGYSSLTQWYVETGGLRRRLRVLAMTARILSELHGRGLVYVDPSPHNVFVSRDADGCEVRLIDTDNVRAATVPGPVLYTPGYGAPEIVRQTGMPTSLSDAHAFAVMAFETLALVHPLLGDMVRDGEPGLEERALAGHIPWIDDEKDEINRSTDGIPRDIVVSPSLRQDFAEMFGSGLREPTRRPGVSRWAEHLDRAADRTLTCPDCSSTYYYDRASCPWCGKARPLFAIAAVFLWDPKAAHVKGCDVDVMPGIVRGPDGKPRSVDAVVLSAGETVILPARVTHGTSGSAPRLRVRFTGDRLSVEALDGEAWRLVAVEGGQERRLVDRPVELALSRTGSAWLVHAGPEDRLHRVIRFNPGAGGRS